MIEPSLGQFRCEQLNLHNKFRSRHGAAPLVLDSWLNCRAQEWAEYLAHLNVLRHSDDSFGQNLASGSGNDFNPVRLWYDEVADLGHKRPEDCLHFTQVVWKRSRNLGLGRARSWDGTTFVVAYYDPPGNVHGSFYKNVQL